MTVSETVRTDGGPVFRFLALPAVSGVLLVLLGVTVIVLAPETAGMRRRWLRRDSGFELRAQRMDRVFGVMVMTAGVLRVLGVF